MRVIISWILKGCQTVKYLCVCFSFRPGIETGGALTYQFDGIGYSSRTDDIKHTREFSLTFRFRSYWKDALLFFTHDPQYVSIKTHKFILDLYY